MKQLLSIVLLCVVGAYSVFAQSEHLSFKGVPIDGTLNAFTKAMTTKGFETITAEDGTILLYGDFAGYKGCLLTVSTLDNADIVNRIIVCFPSRETWEPLYDNYTTIKDMLSIKYGQPEDVVEEFESPYYISDNNDRMHEVIMDRYKYISTFVTDKGDIELSISHLPYIGCCVTLVYYDKINSKLIRAHAIDDL